MTHADVFLLQTNRSLLTEMACNGSIGMDSHGDEWCTHASAAESEDRRIYEVRPLEYFTHFRRDGARDGMELGAIVLISLTKAKFDIEKHQASCPQILGLEKGIELATNHSKNLLNRQDLASEISQLELLPGLCRRTRMIGLFEADPYYPNCQIGLRREWRCGKFVTAEPLRAGYCAINHIQPRSAGPTGMKRCICKNSLPASKSP